MGGEMVQRSGLVNINMMMCIPETKELCLSSPNDKNI